MKATKADADADIAQGLIEAISGLLQGHDPQVQGAALCDLFSMWLAGHPPALRVTLLKMHIETALLMVPLNEDAIFEGRERPLGWDKETP